MAENYFDDVPDSAMRELRPDWVNEILDEAAKTGRIEIELDTDLESGRHE